MGGKRGVGLIVDLSGPSTGTLTLDTLNAPYQIDVYAATTTGVPARLEDWAEQGPTQHAEQPGHLSVEVGVAATHLLVWLKELGPDEACSETNPYRGRLGEISFAP
jgi:hypothetical protein